MARVGKYNDKTDVTERGRVSLHDNGKSNTRDAVVYKSNSPNEVSHGREPTTDSIAKYLGDYNARDTKPGRPNDKKHIGK